MIQSAVTVSLVEQAREGPFVFHGDLAVACQTAARLGFDAIELFAPAAGAVDAGLLRRLLDDHDLSLAAVGTGAGWVVQRLSLCDPDPQRRRQARAFVQSMIEFGGPFGASAIIGSMQGRADAATDKPTALGWLGEALSELGEYARQFQVALWYEPLNRYETNLANTLADGVRLIETSGSGNVRLLADLFHMNIEETDLPTAIRAAGRHIGHVHLADSNRRAAGLGHLDIPPIAQALLDIGYAGYVSAEVLPWPSSDAAAEYTMQAYRSFLCTV